MALESSIDSWFAGEDKTLSFTILDENEHAWVLTGRALVWVLQRGEASPVALVTKSGADIEVDGVNTNVCRVSVGRDDTKDLLDGAYFHALKSPFVAARVRL